MKKYSFKCPQCAKQMKASTTFIGKSTKCPLCHFTFRLPTPYILQPVSEGNKSKHTSASVGNAVSEKSAPQTFTEVLIRVLWEHRFGKPLLVLLILFVTAFMVWETLPTDNRAQLLNSVFISRYKHDWFKVLDREEIVDMALWIEVPQNMLHQQVSPVKRDIKLRIKKLSGDASCFVRPILTSGLGPNVVCFTHSYKVKKRRYKAPSRSESLQQYDVIIDTSNEDVNEEFDIHLQLITWNGFQDKKDEFAGCLIDHTTVRLELKILFPENRRPDLINAYSYNSHSGIKELMDKNSVDIALDRREVSLTKDHLEPGGGYSIDWTWASP